MSDTMSLTPTPHVHHDWQPTSAATQKDYIESKRVCRAIRAAPKRCWSNARKVIERLDEHAEARYVEGWIVKENGAPPIAHGWVVNDGKIIDPTLPDTVATYFPGLEFEGRRGIAAFLRTPTDREHKSDPFHHAFGWEGGDSPSYQKAFWDAMAYQATLFPRECQATKQEANHVRQR
jgi:hypothetical protein